MACLKYLLSIVAICLIGLGIYRCIESPYDSDQTESPFIVDVSPRDLGHVEIGRHELAYSFTNPANRPRRIIGDNEACGNNCCFRSKQKGQVTVQPNQSYDFVVDLIVGKPGKFEMTMTIYVEDNGVRAIELPVSGVGILPKNRLAR